MYESPSMMQVDGTSGLSMIVGVLPIVVAIFFAICMWKIFTKANQPGWKSLIPIYNLFVLSKISGKGVLFTILLFIPVVNIVVYFLLNMGLARNFGKSVGFALGLMILGVIFLPMLAFDDSEYIATA